MKQLESSPELREVIYFKKTTKNVQEIKRYLNLSLFLLFTFSAIIIFSLFKKINFSIIKINFSKEKKVIKPIPEFSFEERLKEEFIRMNLNPKEFFSLGRGDVEILFSDFRVIVSKNKPLKPQLTSLQLIINRFRIEGRRIRKIDLRFKNPIVE